MSFVGGIKNSFILVLDRLSSKGRPSSLELYINVLNEVLARMGDSTNMIYVKLHPADGNSYETKNIVDKLFSGKRVSYSYYNGNLEDIALNDNIIHLLAPTLQYSFMRLFGGIQTNHFCKSISGEE